MEICYKYKIFIKNGRFWNKKEVKMRNDFKILDKNRSFKKNDRKLRNTIECRND